jgi:hypothetical protein
MPTSPLLSVIGSRQDSMDLYGGPEGFQALQCPHCALVAGGGGPLPPAFGLFASPLCWSRTPRLYSASWRPASASPFLVGLTCDPAELPTRLGLA